MHIKCVCVYDRCWSYVGRIGKQQPLSLKVYYCLNRRIIQHEILHALGFHHEHSRSDRDAFVKIQWNNIIDGELTFPTLAIIQWSILFLIC